MENDCSLEVYRVHCTKQGLLRSPFKVGLPAQSELAVNVIRIWWFRDSGLSQFPKYEWMEMELQRRMVLLLEWIRVGTVWFHQGSLIVWKRKGFQIGNDGSTGIVTVYHWPKDQTGLPVFEPGPSLKGFSGHFNCLAKAFSSFTSRIE